MLRCYFIRLRFKAEVELEKWHGSRRQETKVSDPQPLKL
jgi:hypothetical protein